MDWDKLRIFHAVAEAGSFTHAGDALNLSQSAISRQVSALEDTLRTQLFHRHARGLILTEQGEMLYRTAHEVFGKVAMAEALLTDAKDKPSGELKVTTTVGLGSTWLTPRIREFLEMYPDITFNLIVADHELDLSMREADVAIRMRKPTQPELIQRKLMETNTHIYASPDYIKRRGNPSQLADLTKHDIIIYGEEAPSTIANVNWLLDLARKQGSDIRPILKVNNIYGLLLAVESGLGIASLPDYIVRGHGNLLRIMPDHKGPTFDTYFVYPEELRNSGRIGVFRDFLIRQVAEWRN